MNENSFKGNKYRITVLSDILIRFEYSEEGNFLDEKTFLVQNRDFKPVVIEKKEDENYLELKTKYCEIYYTKEKHFDGGKLNPIANLKVVIDKEQDKNWYYKNPEVRNYKATSISTDNNKFELTEKGLYSVDGFATLDDTNGYIIKENELIKRNGKDIDIYLFVYKKDFDKALEDYFNLTGKPNLLPRYAFGNWWSKNYDYTKENIEYLINKFKRYEVPLSVFLFDKTWYQKDKDDKIIYNSKINEDIKTFFKDENIKSGIMIPLNEGISKEDEIYNNFSTKDGKHKIEVDFKKINNVNEYFKNAISKVDNVDFIVNDYYDKKDNTDLNLMQHYFSIYGNRDFNKRVLHMSRNGLNAAHRYGILYTGRQDVSWDTLKNIPFYTSSGSNLGLSYISHDIGGYKNGIENKELYLRYIQLGVFQSILRLASDSSKYYKRMPWKWDYETNEIATSYMRLRHELIPYIYTEAYKYHTKGLTMIKPLYYETPKIYDLPLYKNQYLFGSEMMIAPICEKQNEVMNRAVHKFYLPKGIWYDFKTGKKFPGGKTHTSFYKLEDYPIFCKAGAIIPLAKNNDLFDTNSPKEMEIHIFPGVNNTYELYEDDGITSQYKNGFYIKTSIDYNYQKSNYTIIIRPIEGRKGIIPEKRDYTIRFRNTKETNDIIAYENKNKIEIISYAEDNDFVVVAKNVSTISQITINCKGQDIEIDAIRVINDDIESILSDLHIETEMKIKINDILFGDEDIKRKRIQIRKLKGKKLEDRFVKLFLKLLDYVSDTMNIKIEDEI